MKAELTQQELTAAIRAQATRLLDNARFNLRQAADELTYTDKRGGAAAVKKGRAALDECERALGILESRR